MPKVSVVIPVYNAEKTIARTIESVINQTYQDWELIITDDGSKDDSRKICDKYSKKDPRIKVFSIENGGPSRARNYALSKCIGEYIMFLDSDDLYKNNMIKVMINQILENDCEIVCCNYIKLQGNKEKTIKNVNDYYEKEKKNLYKFIEYLQNNYLYNVIWNKIYRYDIIRDNNIKFDEEIDMGEDYSFNNIYLKYVNSAKFIKESLYIHTIDVGTISSKYRANEFERRIKNIKTNQELYEINGYPMQYIYKKYISAVIGSIEAIMSPKSGLNYNQQIAKVEDYLNDRNIEDAVKYVNMSLILKKIFERKNSVFLYFYVFFRTRIKKIVYRLKNSKYRR